VDGGGGTVLTFGLDLTRRRLAEAVLVRGLSPLGYSRASYELNLSADRYRTIVDVYVLLRRPDGTILLLERSGTGYADGQLCPAGTWRQVNLWSRERSAKRARKQAS
jgi:hypothetical protein